MLQLPSQKDIKKLEKVQSDYCVSIYMPTDKDSQDTLSANRIRFKNLVSGVQKQIVGAGMRDTEAEKLLVHAKELLEDTQFWKLRRRGIAVFTDGENLSYFGVPTELTPEKFTVAERYDIEPLKEMMKQNQGYYILALGQKDIQLLQGDKYHVLDVTPEELPTDMHKTLNIDEQPTHIDNHRVGPLRGDKSSWGFHGHYNIKEEDKKDLMNFFRILDQRINGLMQKAGNPPLILAGLDYLIPMYQQANTYVNLSRQHITKNIRHMQEHDLLNDIKPLLRKSLQAT